MSTPPGMRPSVAEALAAQKPAVPALGRKPSTPGPLHDLCAVCRKTLRVHDRAWEALSDGSRLQTDEALVAAGNYCDDATCGVLAVTYAAEVAADLRKRREHA